MENGWHAFWTGFAEDFSGPMDPHALGRLLGRLIIAAVLGGLLGLDRELKKKRAGLRTFMMVTLGSALVVIIAERVPDIGADISRVIQGVILGIGFLGAGAIIKHESSTDVVGLTTAAGIWFAAGIGLAAGLGQIVAAVVGTILALIVFIALAPIERWIHRDDRS
jgi:putative Mg2+ transporter-C (MgtC) family protein